MTCASANLIAMTTLCIVFMPQLCWSHFYYLRGTKELAGYGQFLHFVCFAIFVSFNGCKFFYDKGSIVITL
ncbi:hypothetical protein XELAEV_18010059mg [Xenopus laevis]|uniref:Uncharacterized protein n=1 Tax=Xenopus laevis TaxID=8355 RepID=A0A974DVW6_XENLA|nr:hypothetical protein XELAEV_18010059mg [Xenopus laevis]